MKENVRQLKFGDKHADLEKELTKIQANRHPLALLLDGLTDLRNIGSIFRLADAANIEKIYLYNCNFDPHHKKAQRTARSTIQYVSFEHLDGIEAIEDLCKRYELIGLEITNTSMDYREYAVSRPILLAIGAERTGISEDVLALCSACIHLPMYGVKTSMNVLCATGIAVYHLVDKIQRREADKL